MLGSGTAATTRSQTTGQLDQMSTGWARRLGMRLIIGLVVLVGLAILLFFFSLVMGVVIGEEFSPGNFQRRTFIYAEIPFIHLQVSPIKRTFTTDSLAKYLARKNYIKKTKSENSRWHLVHQSGINSTSPKCDARILCQYLDSSNAEMEQVWLIWTEKRPELSIVLWPTVADLARRQHYILAPQLFELAENASDANWLRNRINMNLAKQYQQLAQAQQQMGNEKKAIEFFKLSLSYDPDDLASLRGLATSQEAADNQKRAAAAPASE